MENLKIYNIKSNKEKRIYSLNLLVKFSTPLLFLYDLFYLIASPRHFLPEIIFLSSYLLLVSITYLWLYKKNKYNATSSIVLILQSLLISATVFFGVGTNSGNQYYFLLLSLIPLALYPYKQLLPWFSFFIVNISAFIYAEFYYENQYLMVDFPEKFHQSFKISSVLFSMSSIAFVLWIFYYTNEIRENSLITQSERLEKLNNELEESNATKDKFLNIIGHDLKNPLSNILGFSEYLSINASNLKTEEIEEHTQQIFESSQRTNQLINNLLYWSRTQSDQIQIKPETISLKEILNENIQLIIPIAEKKEVLIKNITANDISIFADRNTFDTVIRNILTNAIKFSKKDGTVEISSELLEHDTCTIHFSDTGVGISKKALRHLFKFDNPHSSKGTEGEAGTGLGLILVKEFIEKNNGTISIQSEIDKGTIVSITVPCHT